MPACLIDVAIHPADDSDDVGFLIHRRDFARELDQDLANGVAAATRRGRRWSLTGSRRARAPTSVPAPPSSRLSPEPEAVGLAVDELGARSPRRRVTPTASAAA